MLPFSNQQVPKKGKRYLTTTERVCRVTGVCFILLLLGLSVGFVVHGRQIVDDRRADHSHLAHLAEQGVAVCAKSVKVFTVGMCNPAFVVDQDCKQSPAEAHKAAVSEIAHQIDVLKDGKDKLREVTLTNGARVKADSFLPSKVWILVNNEQFVFPACALGDSYLVELPSVSKAVNVSVLSTSPRVLSCEGFLTEEESDKIVAEGKSKLERSTVSGQGNKAKNIFENSRTSSTAWLNSESNSLAHVLSERVSELVGIPRHHEVVLFEDLQVLRYEIDQHYFTHHDYFDPNLHRGYLNTDGRNRFVTIFFYLNDVEEGGETAFPMAGDKRPLASYSDCSRGLKVKPQKGKVVIFYSLKPEGQFSGGLDEHSWHAGCDVKKGVKYGANFWISLKGVHPDKVEKHPPSNPSN